MGDIRVELLPEQSSWDGTLMNIIMAINDNPIKCEIFNDKDSFLKGDHHVTVAYQKDDIVGFLAYNKTKKRIDRLCAKSPEVDEKLRLTLAKRIPKVKRHLLGTPTFTSPPGYTSDPGMNFESQIRGEFKLPSSAIEEEDQNRSTGRLTAAEPMKSTTLGIKSTKGGRLHTRRRKGRNGSATILRNRARRMSRRKIKA